MIQLYAKGTTDFSKNGISLRPTESTVTFQDNGQYDLEIVIPAKSEFTSFDYGQILRATVPTQNVAAVELGTVSYYQVINAEGSTLYSEVPTLRRVWYKAWTWSQVTPVYYSVGDKVTYNGQNYRCIAFDASSPMVEIPPNANSSWWTAIANTEGTPGKVAAELDQGDLVMKTADFNSEYIEAATLDGKQGYIKLADLQATGETEQRTVPARTIAEQNFTITEIRKEQNNQAIRITAEHVSYQLGRTILGDCNVANVTPATALLFIQGAMQEAYSGNLYTNITGLEVTADWSWKNAQAAILDPKNGLLGLTDGWMIRDDLDVFLLEQGTPAPKYAVRYGANMKSVKWTGNVGDIVTRIYPIAKNEDGSTLMLPEKYIDTARTIPFIRPEVLDTKLKVGDTVKNSDGTETTLTQEDVWLEMRNQCYNRFNIDKCDQAEVNLELDWVYMPDTVEYAQYTALANAAPGDWVEVANGPLGISELIRMTGYRWDPMLEKYKSTTFGPNKEKATVAGYSLQNGSVTARAIANNSVGSSAIMAGSVTAREIEANSITADRIASRSIITELIAADAVTANEIVAYAITAEKIAASAVTADKILAGAVTAAKIAADAVTAEKILAGAVTAVKIAANAVTTEKLDAGAVTAAKIAAGAINADKIDAGEISAINAKLGTATITNGMIDNANISYAKIMDASVQNLIAKDAVTDVYYIDKLQVRNAQMVYATIGELVIKASDNKYYRLDIGTDGSVSPTEVTLTAAEIAAGETSDGHAAIIETDLTVADLSASNMKGISALIDKITASRIDVGELWARQAFINQLMVQDISSNTYIQSTIGDWQSQSTITQTINGISSRISSLGYGTIYYSETEPDHNNLVEGDVWIQPISDQTWNDVSEMTWAEVASYTWEQIAGQYRMYTWTGTEWRILFDNMIISELATEIAQNAYAITLKANQSEVDTLSGEVSDFAATLEVQSEAITAAVSSVNRKSANYTQLTDPSLDSGVSLNDGDTWTKAAGNGTWNAVANYTWNQLAALTWDEVAGASTYVWDATNERWIKTADYGMESVNRSMLEMADNQITLLVQNQELIGTRVDTNTAQITIVADRITQEVTRATNAEGGKIDKTTQYQTADAIVSEAVSEAATSASNTYLAKTSSYQTADAIVTEAVRQAGVLAANGYIQKTTTYQTADAIVSTAESYADGAASTAETNANIYAETVAAAAESNAKNASIARTTLYQSANAIVAAAERYTDNNAYAQVSGIAITSSGVDISGSQYVKIASGGYLQVTTGNFGIDTNSSGYVMWSGAATAADSYFRVKKNGEVTLTKLMILNEQGTEAEYDLKTGGLWKLNYRTVKTLSATTSGSTTTLTLGTSNGDLTVNFNSAGAVTVSAIGYYDLPSYSSTTKKYTFGIKATASNGNERNEEMSFLATAAYDDGYAVANSLYTHYGQAQLYYKVPGADQYVSAGSHNWYYK